MFYWLKFPTENTENRRPGCTFPTHASDHGHFLFHFLCNIWTVVKLFFLHLCPNIYNWRNCSLKTHICWSATLWIYSILYLGFFGHKQTGLTPHEHAQHEPPTQSLITYCLRCLFYLIVYDIAQVDFQCAMRLNQRSSVLPAVVFVVSHISNTSRKTECVLAYKTSTPEVIHLLFTTLIGELWLKSFQCHIMLTALRLHHICIGTLSLAMVKTNITLNWQNTGNHSYWWMTAVCHWLWGVAEQGHSAIHKHCLM